MALFSKQRLSGVLLLHIACTVLEPLSARSVTVDLKAKWNETSFLHESALYMAEKQAFWDFLGESTHRIVQSGKSVSDIPQEQFAHARGVVSTLLPVNECQLFETAISTRYFSPRIEGCRKATLDVLRRICNAREGSQETLADGFVHIRSRRMAYVMDSVDDVQRFMQNFDFSAISSSTFAIEFSEDLQGPFESGHCAYSWGDSSENLETNSDETVITLFGSLRTFKTAQLHQCISQSLTQCHPGVRYVYREIPDGFSTDVDLAHGNSPTRPMGLSGFDVSFVVKSTEYTAYDKQRHMTTNADVDARDLCDLTGIDFRILMNRYSSLSAPIRSVQNSLYESLTTSNIIEPATLLIDDATVSSFELKTSVAVIRSDNPLQALTEIATSLPRHVKSIGQKKVSSKNSRRVIDAIQHAQKEWTHLSEGDTVICMQGRVFPAAETSIFSLLEAVFRDRYLFETTREVFKRILTTDVFSTADVRNQLTQTVMNIHSEGPHPSTSVSPQRVHIPSAHINWFNDLERDPLYATFPADPMRMYTSPFPVPIRKNLFHLVVLIDPSNKASLETLFDTLSAYQSLIAIRIGICFVPPLGAVDIQKSTTFQIATVYRALTARQLRNPAAGIAFLSKLLQSCQGAVISPDDIDKALKTFVDVSHEALVNSVSATIKMDVAAAFAYADASNLVGTSPACFFNGARIECTESPQRVYLREFDGIHPLVIDKRISMSTADCYKTVLSAFGAVERYHPVHEAEKTFFSSKESIAMAETIGDFSWFTKDTEPQAVAAVTYIMRLDVSEFDGLQTLAHVARHIRNHAEPFERFSIHIYSEKKLNSADFLECVIAEKDAKMLCEAVDTLIAAYGEEVQPLNDAMHPFYEKYPHIREICLRRDGDTPSHPFPLACPTGHSIVFINGRVINLTELARSGYPLQAADYATLSRDAKRSTRRYLDAMNSTILTSSDTSVEMTDLSNAFAIICGLYNSDAQHQGERIGSLPLATDESLNAFPIPMKTSPSKTALFPGVNDRLFAVIDPLSIHAAKSIALLETLQRVLGCDASIYLNPKTDIAERPVLHFVSHCLTDSLEWDLRGALVPPRSTRNDLPENLLLSLTIHEPASWIVFPKHAAIDPDNIRLGVESALRIPISYELDGFVLQGKCSGADVGNPSNRMMLRLDAVYNNEKAPSSDTLVMANFGYFQLQHSLGRCDLYEGLTSLHDRVGRVRMGSREIQPFDGRDGKQRFPLFLDSFGTSLVTIDVLKSDNITGNFIETPAPAFNQNISVFDRLLSFFRRFTDDTPSRSRQTVNIFSIASGHLYERFLRLMMFRVTQTTSAHVKFWFIEDFLSPRFKRLLPHFAAKFGCSYELVTYKWPQWLRKQTNKQRMIWAYKVLFLDVLFPQSVERIIFVDADQIVQSDIAELYNTNLRGRAVGYVPLCVSNCRNDTLGYRFWNTGHWKEHLQGKPYHISAIYVVDLKLFREIGAGDIYRSAYESLTADPKNLANLDQDLPNYLQDIVPIHSLPEEWLWCETWCDDKSLRRAKTIDLCNNPLTKAPKIEVAMRVIPKWKEWDDALTEFEEGVLTERVADEL